MNIADKNTKQIERLLITSSGGGRLKLVGILIRLYPESVFTRRGVLLDDHALGIRFEHSQQQWQSRMEQYLHSTKRSLVHVVVVVVVGTRQSNNTMRLMP
jgi:hypothetical protein